MSDKTYISEIPDLIHEWDWDKNNKISLHPNKLLLGSNKKAWWKCKNDHEYIEFIYNKAKGKPCPYCANKRVLIGYNDLNTLYPDLAKEWDYDKNDFIDINEVVRGSNRQVWWKCALCGNEWLARVSNRTLRESGCPQCAKQKRANARNKTILEHSGGLNKPLLLAEWDYEANGDYCPPM